MSNRNPFWSYVGEGLGWVLIALAVVIMYRGCSGQPLIMPSEVIHVSK